MIDNTKIEKIIQSDIPFDLLTAGFDYADKSLNHTVSFLLIGFNEYQTIGIQELSTITATTVNELIKIFSSHNEETVVSFFNNEQFEKVTQRASLGKIASLTGSLNPFPASSPLDRVLMDDDRRVAAPNRSVIVRNAREWSARLCAAVQSRGTSRSKSRM